MPVLSMTYIFQSSFLNGTVSSVYSNALHTSPDPNPTEYHWYVVEQEILIKDAQPTNLQQLYDAIV